MSGIDFILARHGQTRENVAHILQGHLPGHLTELGKAQARELGESLLGEPLELIVCSDLARGKDTAAIVRDCFLEHREQMPAFTGEIFQTALLREMDWGPYAGIMAEEMERLEGRAGVETLGQMYGRAGRFLDWMLEHFMGKKVLVIGHGAFNKAIVARVRRTGVEGMRELELMPNAAREKLHLDFEQ